MVQLTDSKYCVFSCAKTVIPTYLTYNLSVYKHYWFVFINITLASYRLLYFTIETQEPPKQNKKRFYIFKIVIVIFFLVLLVTALATVLAGEYPGSHFSQFFYKVFHLFGDSHTQEEDLGWFQTKVNPDLCTNISQHIVELQLNKSIVDLRYRKWKMHSTHLISQVPSFISTVQCRKPRSYSYGFPGAAVSCCLEQ